ncbi:MAG: ROK family protein [Clostridia bacterium]|nr:ROK family protein [Clostridia bacterium]
MYRIGVDLGGTNIAAGIVNDEGKIISRSSVPTGAHRPAEEIVADMAALCHSLIKEADIPIESIAAVGIATPGVANHDTGVVEYANNLPFLRFPLAETFKARFPVSKVSIENDANAAAWGEAKAGAAKGTHRSVMITLGTGVGGGIIIDDKIYSGFNYAGAELGHIVISCDGRQCSCGRKGCWEAYSSATALVKMTEEKIEECAKQGRETLMAEMAASRGKVSGRTSFDAMRAGDEAAREVVDSYLRYLACGISSIINIFHPEVLSIGGGISNEKENLLRPLIPYVREASSVSSEGAEVDIRIATLGNEAGIIGAALLS